MDSSGSGGGGESWETLKTRAKSMKAELDTKMQELGRLNKNLSSITSGGTSPSERASALEGQIQLVVEKREEVERGLSQFEEASEKLAGRAATSAQAAQALRLRDTHRELASDFKRVIQSIDHQFQHARLLPKARGGTKGQDDAEEGLLRERNGLSSSLSMADEVIGMATATRESLSRQSRTLQETNSKAAGITSMFPGLNGLIGKISDRQNKERVVLSLTVASCCFFTIWYKFL
jgi:chromosome segregation ATPase